MKVSININEMVKFRLTPDGMKVIRDYCAAQSKELKIECDWFAYKKPDDEGYFTEQIWTLMQMLGPKFFGSGCLLVGNELILETRP